jgi:L-lactate utilization protein LutB
VSQINNKKRSNRSFGYDKFVKSRNMVETNMNLNTILHPKNINAVTADLLHPYKHGGDIP